MTTPTSMMSKVAQFLNRYPEVRWDRYTDDGKELCFYGWIKRDDGKFDYLELAFDKQGDEKWYSTSSAQYSKDFAKRGGFTHNDCLRVEDLFGDTVNAIKLSPPPAKEEGKYMKKFVVKDLRETFCNKPRHEIHIEGCSHIKVNTYKVGKSTSMIEAETVEEVIKKDEGSLYDGEWSPKDYRIAPCVGRFKRSNL